MRRAGYGGPRERTGRELLAASDEMLIDERQQRPITLEEVACLGEGTTVVKEEEQLRLELEEASSLVKKLMSFASKAASSLAKSSSSRPSSGT